MPLNVLLLLRYYFRSKSLFSFRCDTLYRVSFYIIVLFTLLYLLGCTNLEEQKILLKIGDYELTEDQL